MASYSDQVIYAIKSTLNDSSVEFLAGKLGQSKQSALRRVILTRSRGTLKQNTGPTRVRTSGVSDISTIVFERDEVFVVDVHAEHEEGLDILFNRLASAIFKFFGPNALYGNVEYSWIGEDSRGGAMTVRNPAIRFELRVRLNSLRDPSTYATLEEAEGTVESGDESVVITNAE